MQRLALTNGLKREAHHLGFDLVGTCPAGQPPGLDRFHDWLDAGYAGRMKYLPDRAHAYAHPRSILEGVQSIVMLGMNYRTTEPKVERAGYGRVSRYAWGPADYHNVIWRRLQSLRTYLLGEVPTAAVRGVVDTAPLLEREFAQVAGLGWLGKNTLLLNREFGSWFFLAVLLTDVPLEFDEPFAADHCGSCRACLDACPTDAFPQPYVLDATKCISYLTIELRDAIPSELRGGVGSWLFGCDVCQEVCPWNCHVPLSDETEFAACEELNPVELAPLFSMDDESFRRRFRKTPLWRAKRRGILRNAAIVLGNYPTESTVDALSLGLADREPLVRAACAWALGRYSSQRARQSLATREPIETDEAVQKEIRAALEWRRQDAHDQRDDS